MELNVLKVYFERYAPYRTNEKFSETNIFYAGASGIVQNDDRRLLS